MTVIDAGQPLLQLKMFKKLLLPDKPFLLLIYWLLCAPVSEAVESTTAEQLDSWFEQEEMPSTEMVSEGELRFLHKRPSKPVLHSVNKLTVFEKSLDDGWLALSQCYRNLDPVAESEVVYYYKSMRDLKIASYRNIEIAQIQGQSIQLTNVKRNAELCMSAMVRIFYQNQDDSYSLINGPFHRKFLDGYYPYHLTLEVTYPKSRLKLIKTKPSEQPGFTVDKQEGRLVLDGIFEGILNVEIMFLAK